MGRLKDERKVKLPISSSCGDRDVTKTQRTEMLAQLKGSESLELIFFPFFVSRRFNFAVLWEAEGSTLAADAGM